jgi:hypothetical protein
VSRAHCCIERDVLTLEAGKRRSKQPLRRRARSRAGAPRWLCQGRRGWLAWDKRQGGDWESRSRMDTRYIDHSTYPVVLCLSLSRSPAFSLSSLSLRSCPLPHPNMAAYTADQYHRESVQSVYSTDSAYFDRSPLASILRDYPSVPEASSSNGNASGYHFPPTPTGAIATRRYDHAFSTPARVPPEGRPSRDGQRPLRVSCSAFDAC